ncbi:PQQ-dependent sugar dehydrogenase [Gimesia algae]|uniref:Soluble aldose sugar dehydrogenase YliI n=1 Tax=Gimesia algae TaxID=2527971 RepID=A0A517VF63_9PLAN|nr:family 16 glycoside hydrolase [Gimesia algae]QDT91641.1 Soluble aldose sugar dehydrogenase YliI precursor [Gimesia algae]
MIRKPRALILFLIPACLSLLLTNTAVTYADSDNSNNKLSKAEKKSGWKLLFDGKTTDGWRNYQKEGISDGWTIKDGVLSRSEKGAGDIITDDQFGFFELSLEYRISPEGNSGLMFHVTEEEKTPWMTGPEVQIQDNVDGHDPQKAGWLYQLYKPATPKWMIEAEKAGKKVTPAVVDATRPAGEWNHLFLRVGPDRSQVIMNGVKYFQFDKGSADWNKRVADSKFSKYPKFGKPTKGHICLQDHNDLVSFRNIKIREIPADGSVQDPSDGELALKGVPAFPDLQWEGWEAVNEETGKVVPLRPMAITHANDGSGRIFVTTQRGMIQIIDKKSPEKTKLFLDLRDKVAPWKKNNEEGLLGLAFHPDFKQNGQFFVYYSAEGTPRKSKVSRFTVSKDDPSKADPNSETTIMEIDQPYGNHNGGCIVFGPDGYLYIGLGDGGSGNDPLGNGQNLETLLGSILRIDVDKKAEGKNYAIPADNPFVDRANAKPEIFAYGVRNIWRLSFDPKTKTLYAGDVGQDLWEEVNIIKKGGNYGWSVREGTHNFGNRVQTAKEKPIDPIWEYDHGVGRSITGGIVYRGQRLPELDGLYVYADYVSGKIWALEYDEASGEVKKNLRLAASTVPVMSFGTDEDGELYYTVQTVKGGEGIFRFEKK